MDRKGALTTPLIVFMVILGIMAASITFYILFKYSATDWQEVKDRSVGHDTYTDLALKNMLSRPVIIEFDNKSVHMTIAELVAYSADNIDNQTIRSITSETLQKYGDVYLSLADSVMTNEVKKKTRVWGLELVSDGGSYIELGDVPIDAWTVVLGVILEINRPSLGTSYQSVQIARDVKKIVRIPTASGSIVEVKYYWRLEDR